MLPGTAHGLPLPPASLPSTFPVKIPESCLVDINQLISKIIEKAKVQNNTEEENLSIDITCHQDSLLLYINEDIMLLVKEQTHISME